MTRMTRTTRRKATRWRRISTPLEPIQEESGGAEALGRVDTPDDGFSPTSTWHSPDRDS